MTLTVMSSKNFNWSSMLDINSFYQMGRSMIIPKYLMWNKSLKCHYWEFQATSQQLFHEQVSAGGKCLLKDPWAWAPVEMSLQQRSHTFLLEYLGKVHLVKLPCTGEWRWVYCKPLSSKNIFTDIELIYMRCNYNNNWLTFSSFISLMHNVIKHSLMSLYQLLVICICRLGLHA